LGPKGLIIMLNNLLFLFICHFWHNKKETLKNQVGSVKRTSTQPIVE
jgi:hypothetical protein